MGRILVRFERVTTDVDTNVTCVRLDDNSENEQCSPEDSIDLSDLVKSFMEKAGKGVRKSFTS